LFITALAVKSGVPTVSPGFSDCLRLSFRWYHAPAKARRVENLHSFRIAELYQGMMEALYSKDFSFEPEGKVSGLRKLKSIPWPPTSSPS
jgi:hypothetical protein